MVVVVQGGMRETQDKVGEGRGPQQQRRVVVLKGQLLHWRLLVANAGQHHTLSSPLTHNTLHCMVLAFCAQPNGRVPVMRELEHAKSG